MDLSAVPYMIISRSLEGRNVFVCLCLVDHMVIGIGLDRDEAMQAMIAELHSRHGGHWDEDGWNMSFARN